MDSEATIGLCRDIVKLDKGSKYSITKVTGYNDFFVNRLFNRRQYEVVFDVIGYETRRSHFGSIRRDIPLKNMNMGIGYFDRMEYVSTISQEIVYIECIERLYSIGSVWSVSL